MADEMNDAVTRSALPRREVWLLRLVLLVAALLFMVGISTPMMTISTLIFFNNSFSIVSAISELFNSGQMILFVAVSLFTLVMPALKFLVLFQLLSAKPSSESMKRYLHLMHQYGRWAMLDVMVVAILVVTVKLGAIASVEVHYGLYLFGASVLIIMLVTSRVVHLTNDVKW
jgi:paraquat-inducible protein A